MATGEATEPLPPEIRLRWSAGTLIAADGLAGYRTLSSEPGSMRLVLHSAVRRGLAPGERRTVAWLRFQNPTEVDVEIPALSPDH
jgi:hypothetical protein